MTVLHAGGKFNKNSYKVSGGLHGVGVSCVNALSTRLHVEVFREGKIYMQEYSKGKPLCAVQEIGTYNADERGTGTCVQFWPDGSIFTETVYQYDILANRMRELAYLNAGVKITLTDKRHEITVAPTTNTEGEVMAPQGVLASDGKRYKGEIFYSEKGLSEFVRYIDSTRTPLISDVIHLNTDKYGTPVEVAMIYNTDFNENIHSYVNNINTIEGGTHVAGFRAALTRVMKKYAEESKLLEKAKLKDKDGNSTIDPNDFREGLTAVISVKVAEPQFEGQTKTKLGNSEVAGMVSTAVAEALTNYLEEHPDEEDSGKGYSCRTGTYCRPQCSSKRVAQVAIERRRTARKIGRLCQQGSRGMRVVPRGGRLGRRYSEKGARQKMSSYFAVAW